MSLVSKIAGAFSGGAGKLVESVAGVVDEFTMSKEEKESIKVKLTEITNQHIQAMEAEATKQAEIAMKDMESARQREVEIATNDKAPMINKIIAPVLAMMILGSCFLFWYMMLFAYIPKEKEVMIAGVTGSLTTLSMAVCGYYFGSSTGSKANSEALRKLLNK